MSSLLPTSSWLIENCRPTIPQHARSQVLSATLDLLQGVKQFRQARAKYTKRSEASPRPFKKRKRDEISQSDVTNTQKQSDSRQFHQIALRSGQQVHIPVHDAPNIPHLSSPRESKEKGKSKQLEPPVAPVIMSSLLVGINSVQSHLELYTQSARAQLSSQGLPFKDPPTQFSWAILLQRRKEARKRKLTNYPILRGSRRATLAHKGHKDPFPRNSASFMFLQNQFGKPLIQSAHQHVISVGKPLPGLDLPSLFLDPSYFSNRGRSILSEGYKKKFNRSQGIKLPPALSEATMAVLQAVGGRETSAFIRKRKKRMTDQQYKERRQARLKEKAAAKSTKEKRHGMEKKPLPETPSTNAYSKGFPNPKPSTKPTRHIFPRPTQEPAHDSLHDPLRIILVCRADVNPQDLLAHFPNTVAAANGLLSRCDRQPIDLVQLNAGAEKALSDALGIKSAAVVGIKVRISLSFGLFFPSG